MNGPLPFHTPARAGLLALALAALPGAALAATTDFDTDGGFKVRADDKSWQVALGGRVHLDAASFDDDVTPLDDDVEFRRARASVRAKLGKKITLFTDYDFGTVVDGWKNAWVQYQFSDNLDVRVGSQTVPFGMADYESSDSSFFMERGLPAQLAPGLLTGALVRGSARSMAWSVGVFGNDLSDDDRRKIDGTSVTGRFTFTPLRKRSNLLHMGASAEYRKADSNEVARFRARPESYVTDARLIDTGNLAGADDLLTLGAEAAWARGPFLLQAEYFASELGRDTGNDASFGGGYVAAGWVLTGEKRRYNRHTGVFGAIDPKGDWGAVEVVARYSQLDLEDGGVTGGKENNIAAGMNWWWNENCRLMVNYIKADASPNRNGVDDSPTIIQARLQVGF